MTETTANPALHGRPLASFLKYAIPSILGILAMSTASVVDGIFIGRYEGSDALASVNLIIPVFSICFGFAYMLAVGGSVSAGKFVGEKNLRAASDIFSKTLMTTVAFGVGLLAAGLWGSEILFGLLGASPELFNSMHAYFDTLIWFLPIQVSTAVYYFFVRIAGYPTLASIALVLGAISNVVMDYWFIAVQGEGLQGAALATGLSSTLTLATLLLYLFKPGRWLQFLPRQKQWSDLLKSAFNGLSEFINEISAGVVTFILNLVIINRLGVDGVAAFSVVSYTLFIGLLFSFSIADALQAVSSQCFGARDRLRLRQFFGIAATIICISSVSFIVLLTSQAEQLIQLFVRGDNASLTDIALSFIQILWPVFLFNGLNVVISAYLTSIHKASASAAIALLRSLILPLGLLTLITQFLPDTPFLYAITLAEAMTLVVALILFLRFRPARILP
ncbi:MAG: MATE family efflux transporter, partial [Pseudomonadota bacterium]|nr:MATE family efflux transporter [Pseudomonadota bacterium]